MSDHLLSILETQIQNQEQLLREREAEVEQLRRHRDRLAELSRQRDELLNQIRGVEGEIALIERTMSSTLVKLGGRMDGPAAPASGPSRPPEPAPEPAAAPASLPQAARTSKPKPRRR